MWCKLSTRSGWLSLYFPDTFFGDDGFVLPFLLSRWVSGETWARVPITSLRFWNYSQNMGTCEICEPQKFGNLGDLRTTVRCVNHCEICELHAVRIWDLLTIVKIWSALPLNSTVKFWNLFQNAPRFIFVREGQTPTPVLIHENRQVWSGGRGAYTGQIALSIPNQSWESTYCYSNSLSLFTFLWKVRREKKGGKVGPWDIPGGSIWRCLLLLQRWNITHSQKMFSAPFPKNWFTSINKQQKAFLHVTHTPTLMTKF